MPSDSIGRIILLTLYNAAETLVQLILLILAMQLRCYPASEHQLTAWEQSADYDAPAVEHPLAEMTADGEEHARSRVPVPTCYCLDGSGRHSTAGERHSCGGEAGPVCGEEEQGGCQEGARQYPVGHPQNERYP